VLRWHPAGPDSILLHSAKDASVIFDAVHEKHYLGHFDPIGILENDQIKA